ncbi:hypothetical protein A6J86_005135 [Streptococcus mutans]|nr:hypothetical protein A6J86_005135 [Streptococcus mutans]
MAHEFSSETSFIKIQRRKTTHRKIGKLTKMHQHLGSLYLFAQCRSRVQFINVLMALLDYYSNKKKGKFHL